MGKSPTEAKKAMIAGKPTIVRRELKIYHYIKPNGAIGQKTKWVEPNRE
jgi:hypothetical protein